MCNNYTRRMVPYEYKYSLYLHELKYLPLMTNFHTSTGTYAPEFTVPCTNKNLGYLPSVHVCSTTFCLINALVRILRKLW